jgi:hypothetical protein
MATRIMPLNELRRAQLEQLRLQNEKARAELNAPVGKSRFQVLLTYPPALASKMAASMAATAKMSYSEFESNQFKYR